MSTKQKDSEQLDPGSGNVEQIREILFGGHIRAFDERFELVESRLAKESDSLRKAIEKRVLELERLLGDFRDEANDRLGAESSKQDLALNTIELALAQSRVDSENQMAAMEDRFTAELNSIKAGIKSMHKELTSAQNAAGKAQQKRTDQLDEDKVTRNDLSTLLSEVAKSLQAGKGGRGK